ncbi:V-type ATP synthase subunit I [Neptuniibacter sp. CAU 1671]|uniref:V-type ATP synthase subunit I n=1 Tax=Neptuniibacter sp. CAU 1671 TaxID=3032593 RepID=UPI0023DCC320|nr:V-type ATP synthase subunit I [Neptuniibacter sp. CAU 1671]MDF2181269.1 V-type ATP synthase subunit I [Neptuniibacter sp. CAU 1671]
MSIARLVKATLIGLSTEKESLLDQLQTLGLLHIVPLREKTEAAPQNTSEVSPELLHTVLRYLLDCPDKRRQVTSARHFDLPGVTHQADTNRQQRLALLEQRDFLQNRINGLQPWGDFRLPESGELYAQKLWFYLVPNYRMAEVERSELIWQQVHRDNRHSYIAVIAEQEPAPELMPVARTHTGAIPLSLLQKQLEDVEVALEAVEAERQGLTRWLFLLQCSVAGTADAAQRADVASASLDAGEIFALQGWLPESALPQLEAFTAEKGMVLQWSEPEPAEQPPTLLQNDPASAAGEEIVHFFQEPGYRSWDPSRTVFLSFVTFFALIMSDAGYALLLGCGFLLFWKRFESSQRGRRIRTLGLALSGASLIWGVLVGSYFGAPPPDWLADWKQFDLYDFDSMMRLSICLGVLHLVLANLMLAWVRRKQRQALASVGWALMLSSALAGWLFGFNLLLQSLFALGVLLVFGCSGTRTGYGWRRWLDGLLALTNISKLFGDVLSYLRLFALGLASASLAITFNQLAQDVALALPVIGLFFKVLILLLGHMLNFLLTVISGVVHGLRLNLIEFYNWSLADEGYIFQPFAKQEVSPWIT